MNQPTTLSPAQMQTLRAACDALIPSLRVVDDPHRFYASGANELGAAEEVARIISALPRASQRGQSHDYGYGNRCCRCTLYRRRGMRAKVEGSR